LIYAITVTNENGKVSKTIHILLPYSMNILAIQKLWILPGEEATNLSYGFL